MYNKFYVFPLLLAILLISSVKISLISLGFLCIRMIGIIGERVLALIQTPVKLYSFLQMGFMYFLLVFTSTVGNRGYM